MIANLAKIPYWLLAGLTKIFTRRKLFILNAIPYLIGILSFFFFSGLSFSLKDEFISLFLSNESSWYFISLSWLAFLFSIAISAALSLLTYLLLGSIFIEFATEELLRLSGFAVPEHDRFKDLAWAILKSFKDDGVRLVYITVLSILMFVCSFFPLLTIIPIILTAFIVGLDLLNLPLALLEIPISKRLKLTQGHFIETCALGGLFTVCALVPFLGIILYPAFLNVSVELITRWKQQKLGN